MDRSAIRIIEMYQFAVPVNTLHCTVQFFIATYELCLCLCKKLHFLNIFIFNGRKYIHRFQWFFKINGKILMLYFFQIIEQKDIKQTAHRHERCRDHKCAGNTKQGQHTSLWISSNASKCHDTRHCKQLYQSWNPLCQRLFRPFGSWRPKCLCRA